MHLGIGSYTYPWSVGVAGNPPPPQPLTPVALLDRAVALGVRVVQFCDNSPLNRLSAAELDDLRRQAETRELKLEYGTAGIGAEHLRREIEIATRLGARVLRVTLECAGHEPSVEEGRGLLAPLVDRLEACNVTLAIENHDRFTAGALRRLIDEVGSERVGACLDTANSFGASEGPDAVLEILGPRAVCWHVKDYVVRRLPHRFGFVVEGCPAGQGRIDIAHWVRRLRALGRDVNAIVELWPPPEPELAQTIAKEQRWAGESVTYLRRFLPN